MDEKVTEQEEALMSSKRELQTMTQKLKTQTRGTQEYEALKAQVLEKDSKIKELQDKYNSDSILLNKLDEGTGALMTSIESKRQLRKSTRLAKKNVLSKLKDLK